MPRYIAVLEREGVREANGLFSTLLSLALVGLTFVAFALSGLAPLVLPFLGSGFDNPTQVLVESLFQRLLPLLLLAGIGRLYITAINAHERFALVGVTPVITPLCTVLFIFVFAESRGVAVLVDGLLLGAGLELLILLAIAARLGLPIVPGWGGFTPELRSIGQQYAPMIVGSLLMGGTLLVDQAMAAMLEPGSVATLKYAGRVAALVVGLGGMVIGTVVLPHFSRMVASEDWAGLRQTVRTYSRLILVTTIPCTAILFLLSNEIVQLLFERGAFTIEDTGVVGQTQALYVLQIPSYVVGTMMARLVSALGANRILMLGSAISLPLNLILNYVFMQTLDVAGIALSTACVYLTSAIFLHLMGDKLLTLRLTPAQRDA